MRWLYTLLFYLISPFLLVRLWQRGQRAPAYLQRWGERFGRGPVLTPGVLWIHAVSVGETVASAPLVKALQQRYPDLPLLVTTMTPTGSERVRALFGDSVQHAYAPYDLPHAVGRFLRRCRPRALIVMETELWPNTIHACHRRGLPVILANARLSERSARGYGRVSALAAPMLAELDWVAAQAQADADRFERLGVPPGRIEVTGSIKFDISLSATLRQQAGSLRQALGRGRPVWIGASTHDGEDAILLAAHQRLLKQHPEALLILVPRHPERFAEVGALVRSRGLTLALRSRDESAAGVNVLLGDTMGELLMLYGAADVAFVGGSLVESGGHNPLEPAAWGMPVLMGPHVFNFADICARLTDGQGLCFVGSEEVLVTRLQSLLEDPEHRLAIGQHALAVVEANRGALDKLLAGLDQRLAQDA